MDVGLPEEVELRWLACLGWADLVRAAQVCSRWHRLASDASLWEDAFVREFGDTAAAAVRSTSSVRQALDRLWGADQSTSIEYSKWTANFLLDTRLYQPSRTEGAEYNVNAVARNFCADEPTYDELWDRGEVQPHQEDHLNDDDHKGEHDDDPTKKTTAKPWKAVFLRHYLLRYRWLYGCEPQPGGNTKVEPADSVMRGVVAGMKSSGKSHFLRTLAPNQNVEDGGCNVVVVTLDNGRRMALLEMRRPNGWFGKKYYNGAPVSCMVFMVDSTEFRPFLNGEIGSDEEYRRMEDIYKRFHGVAGQAHLHWLVGIVCAHKIDLATSEAEKEELREVINRKLRVDALKVCSWYCLAKVTTLGTSATDRRSCLAAIQKLAANHKVKDLA